MASERKCRECTSAPSNGGGRNDIYLWKPEGNIASFFVLFFEHFIGTSGYVEDPAESSWNLLESLNDLPETFKIFANHSVLFLNRLETSGVVLEPPEPSLGSLEPPATQLNHPLLILKLLEHLKALLEPPETN